MNLEQKSAINRSNQSREILKTVFGYDTFRPLQGKIINHVLDKKDALVVMPTGGGKSLCYQIPGMIFNGLTIVVSPLISLMKDQVDQLRENGVAALFLNSALSIDQYRENVEKLKENKVKLLYVSPETLLTPRTLSLLASLKVDALAIDEAHCVSQWGHDFRPEYRQLSNARAAFPHACCVALTATATPRVREDIRQSLQIAQPCEFVGSFNRPNLFLEVAPKTEPLDQLLNLIDQYPNESGIIYCATRRQTDELYAVLQRKKFSVRPYHAGLAEAQRTENQERFSRDDVRIIVATIAFGMGINKPNVRFVVHYDLPQSIDNYYQEIGRAGRDGLPAHCLLLFGYGDIQKARFFIDKKTKQEQVVANILLTRIIGLAETDLCRRVPLLNYFGETDVPDECGMCDNCRMDKDEKELADLTVPAQKFLSCVKRTDEIFGAGHIVDVLRGSKCEKVRKFHHDQLSTYGIGLDYSANQWKSIGRQLIQKGLLQSDYEHGSLKLTEKAWEVLKNKEKFLGRLEDSKQQAAYAARQQSGEAENFDKQLFEILRAKRKEIADSLSLPPYVIFHDRTLREMAFYFPSSRESVACLYGVGKSKLEKFANLFLELISKYCREHGISEKPKSEATTAPAPLAASSGGGLRHMLIGGLFNEGCSIEELSKDFNIQRGTVIDYLSRYYFHEPVCLPEKIIQNSQLTQTQREAVFASFDRLGANRLRPVFDEHQGAIPYEELKLCRINYQSKAKNNSHQQTFVCLASSRKYGGFCIAGKDWTDDKIGDWIRPVSLQENGELGYDEILLDNGNFPQCLDVISISTNGAAPHPYQKENIRIAENSSWLWRGRLSPEMLYRMTDDVDELWPNGFHSAHGNNDRVPEKTLLENAQPSLYLISPDNLTILVSDDIDGRKKVRAEFSYRKNHYRLSVTDPVVEKIYLSKDQGIYPQDNRAIYLTASLSEPFSGYCYKLAAAIILSREEQK
jgi:ATP-dependent DNA helicase RecQ